MSLRWEWTEQAELLDSWPPADAVWAAADPVARSAVSGLMCRLSDVKRGVPDCLAWCRHTRTIAVELKSRMREKMLSAGVIWWEARSANAAMVALAESGARLRRIINADGTVERLEAAATSAV
ncbi:MAG: hypothetical protein J2P54_00360 [Bradyrhizobiaceae bacterium]|nr:hypothetical protein [Bradyrhizobiaceae bacterium]